MRRSSSAISPLQTRISELNILLAEGLINASEHVSLAAQIQSKIQPREPRRRNATETRSRPPRDADGAAEDARARVHLPFYLYEGGAFDEGGWFEPCGRGLRGERVEEDQYAGEHYFYAQLRSHRWRTRDPERALLFVVPLYANAALQPSVKGASCNGTHFQRLFDATAAAVAATAQYQRHLGADHVLVSNSWRAALRTKQAPWAKEQLSTAYFRHTFRNAIVGHMEVVHKQDDGWWRCSVVSPYVANFDEAARAHEASPTASRKTNFYFHGGANNRGTYGYAFRQAALAQLQALPSSYLSAIELPGNPAPCRGAVTTNCRAGRSTRDFRERMASTKFNLVLRGDSPSSRRLYDGLAAGALPVLVSDQIWSVGLPFQCLVPWRRFAVSIAEASFVTAAGAEGALRRLAQLPAAALARLQRSANRHRRDVVWNMNGSRVAENVLLTAALRCLPAHAAPRRAEAAREDDAPSAAAALARLRAACVHRDTSLACRVPDGERCPGCEVGAISPATPVEHCCADSCPSCNRSADARCLPPDVFHGDPLLDAPARRQALLAYLDATDKKAELPPPLQAWRAKVGRPGEAPPPKPKAKAAGKRGGRPPGR